MYHVITVDGVGVTCIVVVITGAEAGKTWEQPD